MEIYIDLTLLSLFLNGIVSLYFVRNVILKPIKWYFYLIVGFINIMQIVYMYHNFYLSFFVYFLVMLLVFLKYFKSNYFSYLSIYIMFMYVSQLMIFLFFRGLHFYNGLFYVENSYEVFYLFSYLFIMLLIYFMTLFVDKCFHLNSFKEKVILIFNNKKFITDGYYDTGNLLLYNNIPVVFISKKHCQSDVSLFDRDIEVATINGKVLYKCKEALLSIASKKDFHYVYLCLCDEDSFNGCDLLLNAYLL